MKNKKNRADMASLFISSMRDNMKRKARASLPILYMKGKMERDE